MPDNGLSSLQAIDATVLQSVVRADQRSPSFAIIDWSVQRLRDQRFKLRDDLWLFSGHGRDSQGIRHWSVVLKILNRRHVYPPEQIDRASAHDMLNWEREFLVAQSGLTERLPGPVRAPRFYEWEETPAGAWIWMEHVLDTAPDRWTSDEYTFAAHELGRWSGAFTKAGPPVEPWFAHQHYYQWVYWFDIDQAWQFPLNRECMPDSVRARLIRLWAEREALYAVIERLPQIFSHFDLSRGNLLTRREEGQLDQLVAIDWAQCGLGPLGAELTNLIGMSVLSFGWPPAEVRKLDAVVFESYLAGLAETDWAGKADIARLGYAAWMAACVGCMMPGVIAARCSPQMREWALDQFGLAEEDLFWQYMPVLNYVLDCADEARLLATRLGL